MNQKPHSADYFGDTRDFWWNRDFLELMSARWDLRTKKRVLDVGCGIGHWGRCLAPFLAPDAVLTGIDREQQWVEEARKRSAQVGSLTTDYREGEAERLPFPDGSFDLVTCQTLLIHVPDPVAVLREMIRVLAPGGLIAVVEPNNLAANLSWPDLQKPADEAIARVEFQMRCERGKMNLGEGFNSIGPFIAGWLSELGLREIKSYLADKTTLLVPPYDSAQQRAVVSEAERMYARNFWIWNRDDTLRYFLAGGGKAESFEAFWINAMSREKDLIEGVQRGNLGVAFAPVSLLVSGRKKSLD